MRRPPAVRRAPCAVRSHSRQSGIRTYFRSGCGILRSVHPSHKHPDDPRPDLSQESGRHLLFYPVQVLMQMPLPPPDSDSLPSGNRRPAVPAPAQRRHS